MNKECLTLQDLHDICRHFNVSITMNDYKQLQVFCHSGVGKIYGYRPVMDPRSILELMREYSEGKPFPIDHVLPNGLVDNRKRDNYLLDEVQKEKHERDCRKRDRRDGIID